MAAKRPAPRPARKRAPQRKPKPAAGRPRKKAVKPAPARAPAKQAAAPRAVAPAPAASPRRAVAVAGAQVSAAQRWSLVTAKDIMRKDVVTVSYASPLSEVERVLADHRISGAPVVDEKGAIIGVVSLKDLVQRYAQDPDARPRRGRGFFHLSSEETLDDDFESFEVPDEAEEVARDVMTASVYTVPAGAGLQEIAQVLCENSVHRVLVEERGRLVGLVSTLDILEALRA